MTINAALSSPQPVKLTIADYLLLDHAGAFAAYPGTELIDGVIVALSPQYRPHAYAKSEIAYRLRRALEGTDSPLYVGHEVSVEMPPSSMPQPDIVVTSEPRGEGAIPLASVALLVEIADSTAAFDLGEKVRIYAANGVPDYWVIDLPSRSVHQKWSPADSRYALERELPLGAEVSAATIGGLSISTEGI